MKRVKVKAPLKHIDGEGDKVKVRVVPPLSHHSTGDSKRKMDPKPLVRTHLPGSMRLGDKRILVKGPFGGLKRKGGKPDVSMVYENHKGGRKMLRVKLRKGAVGSVTVKAPTQNDNPQGETQSPLKSHVGMGKRASDDPFSPDNFGGEWSTNSQKAKAAKALKKSKRKKALVATGALAATALGAHQIAKRRRKSNEGNKEGEKLASLNEMMVRI